MPASIRSIGYQFGLSRFEVRFEDSPYIAQWRANSTALSQVHNLYFIAYGSTIGVYVPQFPGQQLPRDPVLTCLSQPSSTRLTGYIDRRNPHCINNLVVQFLGTEEVVAVVRDDGDVDAFLIRHIVQAIERRSEATNQLGLIAREVRPFFQANVGISAWGLAIHAEARILAVSSNNHEVRVFKFGLLQDEDEVSQDEGQHREATDEQGENDARQARERDVTHHILNGETNIPHISFCNTGDDPEGRWLLTTDISGICRVMDLQELRTVQTFRFGPSRTTPGYGGFDENNAGWLIAFLNRRSFQEEQDVQDALGLEHDELSSGLGRNPGVWDLSKAVNRLTRQSKPFVYNPPKQRQSRRRSSTAFAQDHQVTQPTLHTSENDVGDEDGEESTDESDGGAPLEVDIETAHEGSEAEDQDIGETSQDDDPEDPEMMTMRSDAGLAEADVYRTPSAEDLLAYDPIQLIDDGEDPDDEMTEDTISYNAWYSGETISYNVPQYRTNDKAFCDDLPCPILHASMRNIYLLQPTNQQIEQGPCSPPMLGLANPLRQQIQQDFDFLVRFNRLNMSAYIQPLGIVIVASQKGRAIVLALTKLPASTKYQEDMLPRLNKSSTRAGSSAYRPEWMNKTIYAMRIEAILPFAQQEEAGERPFAPLHGVAVSPLQGFGPDGGRWRLMMMYQDHSILSYEISRAAGSGHVRFDSGTGVEGVIV